MRHPTPQNGVGQHPVGKSSQSPSRGHCELCFLYNWLMLDILLLVWRNPMCNQNLFKIFSIPFLYCHFRKSLRNSSVEILDCRSMLPKSLRDTSRECRGTVANREASRICRRNTWLPFCLIIINPALTSVRIIAVAPSIGSMLMRIQTRDRKF